MKPTLLLFASVTCLAGCTLGPAYRARAPQPAAAGAFQAGLAVDPAGPMPARWWSLYSDPQLDALVEEALQHNSDLRVAAANLERAQAVLQEQRASLLPSTQLTSGLTYGRTGVFGSTTGQGTTGTGSVGARGTGTTGTGATGTGTTGTGTTTGSTGTTTSSTGVARTIGRAGIALSYEVDLFGRVRRSIEAARADVAATEATRDATRVTVAAATTQAYFDSCLLGRRVDVGNEALQLITSSLQGIQRQVRLGVGSQYDVSRQAVLVEQQRAVK